MTSSITVNCSHKRGLWFVFWIYAKELDKEMRYLTGEELRQVTVCFVLDMLQIAWRMLQKTSSYIILLIRMVCMLLRVESSSSIYHLLWPSAMFDSLIFVGFVNQYKKVPGKRRPWLFYNNLSIFVHLADQKLR